MASTAATATGTGNRVLIIGMNPASLSSDDYEEHKAMGAQAANPEAVNGELARAWQKMADLGYACTVLALKFDTAESVLTAHLKDAGASYNTVLIGAGLRVTERAFPLFEKTINLVHQYAPQATICFNTSPTTSLEAIERWLPSASLPAGSKGGINALW